MGLEIIPVQPDHVPELGRICFEAFGSLQSHHNIERDFATVEFARQVVGLLAGRDDCVGFAAMVDGRLAGSNFLQVNDQAAGVGPVTVDPALQQRGIGRALMQAVIDEARRRRIDSVRLVQESVNTMSFSLYTKLGFSWRDSLAIMAVAPARQEDPTVRPLTADDLPAIEALSRRHHGTPRVENARRLLSIQYPGFVRERDSRVVAYMFAGMLGHAAAEERADLLALIGHIGRQGMQGVLRWFLCPMSQTDLFRESLHAGCRVLKTGTYMAMGEYTPPRGNWLPSILC